MYPVVAPLELRAGIALFLSIDGFAVHHSIDCNIGFRMREPTSVFTAALAAIRLAMDHIGNEALGRHKKSRYIPIRSCTSVNKNVGN
jgi:hypothetical protein